MATYKDVQEYARANFGFVPQTCWLAHVLSDYGLTTRVAGNRIDATARQKPCPPAKRAAVEAALRACGRLAA